MSLRARSAKIKTGHAKGARAELRLHGTIARDLGVAIVSGKYQPGEVLIGEIESSEQLQVSRTAYREAMRILAAKGLVESRPKVGTRISPREQWHLLDPDVLEWIFSGDPPARVLQSLFEMREVVEPAAAAMAATRRTNQHLENMQHALEQMAQHTLAAEAGRQADKDFHAALLNASGNPFMLSLTNSITAAVDALTRYKQRNASLSRDPVPDHSRVYDAIAAKNPMRAQRAMTELLRLAVEDLPARVCKAKAAGKSQRD